MPTAIAGRDWWWMLAAAALLCLAPGRMALTDPDEARYAEASREMMRDGDLIVPHFNGEPRLSKPPLIYWAQATAFLCLGATETAARLPSLIAALATMALVVRWGERRLGAGGGGTAALALSVTILFFVCARLAITDMLLTLWVTAAVLFWDEAVACGPMPRRRWLAWAASLAAGMAALTKGPVGPALAGVVILTTASITRGRGMITWRGIALAPVGIALVAGPWLACLAGRIGSSGILELLRRESLERAFLGLDHPRPSYYYLVTGWATLFPWSLSLPFVVVRALRGRAPQSRPRDGTSPTCFLFCWLVCTIVFFSLSTDKNDAWLLPAAPALALLAGFWLGPKVTRAVWTAAAVLLVAGVMLASAPLSAGRSLKQLALDSGLPVRGDYLMAGYKVFRPSLVFYLDHPARWVRSGRELRQVMEETPAGVPLALVMTGRHLARLRDGGRIDLTRFRVIGEHSGYTLLLRQSIASQ